MRAGLHPLLLPWGLGCAGVEYVDLFEAIDMEDLDLLSVSLSRGVVCPGPHIAL